MLDEDSRAADRERLTLITDEMPMLVRRVRRLHRAILIMRLAFGLLVPGVVAIASPRRRTRRVRVHRVGLVMAGVIEVSVYFAALDKLPV